MIEAIFFDLDGVLADTETMHQGLTEEYLRKINSPIPPQRFYLLIGSHKSLDPWSNILDGFMTPQQAQQFKRELRAFKQQRLADMDYGKWIFPEVYDALKEIKRRNIRIACASSSSMEYIHRVLSSGGLVDFFDVIVSCDDFCHSKPEPDIYLHCQKVLKVKKENCLVVEDSRIGIEAGKRAQMRVAARKDHRFNLDQSQADYMIEDLRELLELLDADRR